MLVFGDHPYLRDADNVEVPSYDELSEMVRKGAVEDVLKESIKVTGNCPSALCCSLISSLMEKNTAKRLTVQACKENVWVTDDGSFAVAKLETRHRKSVALNITSQDLKQAIKPIQSVFFTVHKSSRWLQQTRAHMSARELLKKNQDTMSDR